AVLFAVHPAGGFSRSILFIDGMLVLLFTTSMRVLFRSLDMLRQVQGDRALVYGAGRAGELAVREMLANPSLSLRPIAFLDDDPAKRGRLVQGYPVVGGFDSIANVIRDRRIKAVVVGSRQLDATTFERLRDMCELMNIDLFQLHLEFNSITPMSSTAAP